MIDTGEWAYQSAVARVGPVELRTFTAACVEAPKVRGVIADAENPEDVTATGWVGRLPQIGRVELSGDGRVAFGRSLSKLYQEVVEGIPEEHTDNGRVLTYREANKGLQAVCERVEGALPFIVPETLQARRCDVVWDRTVPSTMATVTALRSAVKPTRGGCAWFDNKQGVPTGIMFRGRAVVHRVYDKGRESCQARYDNVLRSEEQLRHGSKGLLRLVDCTKREFDREAAVEIMNERYLDVAYDGELDVSELVKDGRDHIALFALHPELLPIYKDRVQKSGYYKVVRQVRKARATAVPAELRLPESAWLEDVA